MPKDTKREFLTGPRKFDEIWDKLGMINERLADDRPVPMDLGNVSTHDARTTQSDRDASNDKSYDDVCAIAWKGYIDGRRADVKGPNGAGTWYRGEGVDEWTSGKRDDRGKIGGKKGSKGSEPDWGDKDQGSSGSAKAKVKVRAKLDIASIAESQGTSE